MKIVSLNIWGGRLNEELLSFLEVQKNEVDIFCFQEVFHHGSDSCILSEFDDPEVYSKIETALSEFVGYFSSQSQSNYGLAVFYRKTLSVLERGDIMLSCDPEIRVNRNLQHISFERNGELISLVNFHGLWTGGGKGDTDTRILQSENILDYLSRLRGKSILVGDYNLDPKTESMNILESYPLKNLITEYAITDTRTSFYKKENRFADYLLCEPTLEIKEFKVLKDEVSDHAPLYLEI